ncbi:MAG: thioesterase family protein [Sedimentibacter sp.]
MIEHKIVKGLSTTHKSEGGMHNTLYSSRPTGELNYLLSTPEILEIIIEASYKMLDPLLPTGYTTVGKYIELSHEQPTLTLLGGKISTTMTVTEVIGNKVSLDFTCHDEIGLICKGRYERFIVNKDKLMEATSKRAQSKM